jgi:hypothetical protein
MSSRGPRTGRRADGPRQPENSIPTTIPACFSAFTAQMGPEIKRCQGAARYDARSARDVAVSERRVAGSWLTRVRAGSRVYGACACRHCPEGGTLMYIGIGTVVLIVIIVLIILLIRR